MTRTFTHDRHLDTDWKPGPGQKYTDAPKRVYEVSRVTRTGVYYRLPGSSRPGWVMDRAAFEARFPGVIA
jgi:hypothetical protein